MNHLRQVEERINGTWNAVAGFFHRRQRWTQAIIIGLYALVIVLLAAAAWRERMLIIQWSSRLTFVVLVGFLFTYSLALTLVMIAWYLIIAQLSGVKSFWLHFCVYYMTNLARRLPGLLWYLVGRAYMYEQKGISKSTVALGSALEAVLSLVAGLIVYLISLFFVQQSSPIRLVWLLGAIIVGAILISPPVMTILYRWKGGGGKIPIGYGNLLIWLLIFMFGWTIGGLTAANLVGAIEPMPIRNILYIIGVWGLSGSLSSVFVFLPGGAGIFEVSMTIMLSQIIPIPLAVFIVVALRILIILLELVWGLIALILTRTCY